MSRNLHQPEGLLLGLILLALVCIQALRTASPHAAAPAPTPAPLYELGYHDWDITDEGVAW